MSTSRRKFSAEFKTKVVLAALKETQTLSELATHYEVHPGLITNWKKQFLEKADLVFSEKGGSEEEKQEAETGKLYEQIGRLQTEINFLKNIHERFGTP